MYDIVPTRTGSRIGWAATIALLSAVTSLALACAAPLAAVAAIGALAPRPRDGLWLATLAWAVNQAIGFGVLGYPTDPSTLAWGPAMLSAALVGVAIGRRAARTVPRVRQGIGAAAAGATAFGAAFIGFKTALLGWSLVLGGVHTALSPYWTAIQFIREGAVFAGLALGYRLAVAAGVPAAGRRAPA